jgi:SAM-dependent methyltransferase
MHGAEPYYPLHTYVCETCFLVQLEEFVPPEQIFRDYAYFSSYSESWLEHSRRYVEEMIERLHLDDGSFVVELASNDGYLLQYFVERSIPCLGVEPAINVARDAINRGVPTLVDFFGSLLAQRLADGGKAADLIVANNVLAQVPDLNDFVKGMSILLAPGGTVTAEFPHLLRLMEGNQYDTIYHEHFSYFGLGTIERIFGQQGLCVFDVEELPTHGGSLRIHARHEGEEDRPVRASVEDLRAAEVRAGLQDPDRYADFRRQVANSKRELIRFLCEAAEANQSVVGYGAPGKGNTLLNYCGIKPDLLEYTVDRNPYKHGRYLPGSRIPVYPPDRIVETKPDFILILPWNLRDEIAAQLEYTREWGARLVVPIPRVEVIT